MTTPLLSEYCQILEEMQQKYGERVTLLMQVGSFYEIYEIPIGEDKTRGNAQIISGILGIHLTRKNGKISSSENNPWMCGVPCYTLAKHLNRLYEHGWTVVVMDQSTEDAKKRKIKGIYSPSLRWIPDPFQNQHELTTDVETTLGAVRIEKYISYLYGTPVTEWLWSRININSHYGNVEMEEGVCTSEKEMKMYIDRWTNDLTIQEWIILWNHMFQGGSNGQYEYCQDTIDWKWNSDNVRHYVRNGKGMPLERKHLTQEKMIRFVYGEESIGLERYPCLMELLTFVFQYIYEHDPCLLKKMQKPNMVGNTSMNVDYNQDFYHELNITLNNRRIIQSHGSTFRKQRGTLWEVLQQTKTKMGRRCLYARLCRPIHDHEELQKRYKEFEKPLEWSSQFREEYNKWMKNCPDLDHDMWLWKTDKLSPIKTGILLEKMIEWGELWRDEYEEMRSFVESIYHIEELKTNGLQFPFSCFRVLPSSIETVIKTLQKMEEEQRKIRSDDRFKEWKWMETENEYYFQTTQKRWNIFQKSYPDEEWENISTRTSVKITHPLFRKWKEEEQSLKPSLNKKCQELFYTCNAKIYEKYNHVLDMMSKHWGEMDMIVSLSEFFQIHSYHAPSLNMHYKNSGFCAKKMRHPIVEHIDHNHYFVPYDVTLGWQSLGYLLYGLNSAGKSTFLRTIGLNVWMAQCGLYVPCESFDYVPFKKLYSKIASFDDIYHGYSTFLMEMHELKYILDQACPATLVLGDELTSGTETKSATGIVGSTILHFLQQKIPFIMTTHLHLVHQIPELYQYDSLLKICHFDCHMEKDKLVYDRQLKEGSGRDSYGIEIAEFLQFPVSFLKTAFHLRERVMINVQNESDFIKDQLKVQTSRYNVNVIVEKCQRCGSTKELQTHHKIPQIKANVFHRIEHHHKNDAWNLEILCQSCHQQHHHSL